MNCASVARVRGVGPVYPSAEGSGGSLELVHVAERAQSGEDVVHGLSPPARILRALRASELPQQGAVVLGDH